MKYIKSINEEFNRVAGFRYSEPKESYKISVLCLGDDITEDKIKRGLGKVSTLKFDNESINITNLDENQMVNTPDGPIYVSAIVEFVVVIYNDREINSIIEELGSILSAAFDIEVLNFKYKRVLDI